MGKDHYEDAWMDKECYKRMKTTFLDLVSIATATPFPQRENQEKGNQGWERRESLNPDKYIREHNAGTLVVYEWTKELICPQLDAKWAFWLCSLLSYTQKW